MTTDTTIDWGICTHSINALDIPYTDGLFDKLQPIYMLFGHTHKLNEWADTADSLVIKGVPYYGLTGVGDANLCVSISSLFAPVLHQDVLEIVPQLLLAQLSSGNAAVQKLYTEYFDKRKEVIGPLLNAYS